MTERFWKYRGGVIIKKTRGGSQRGGTEFFIFIEKHKYLSFSRRRLVFSLSDDRLKF